MSALLARDNIRLAKYVPKVKSQILDSPIGPNPNYGNELDVIAIPRSFAIFLIRPRRAFIISPTGPNVPRSSGGIGR